MKKKNVIRMFSLIMCLCFSFFALSGCGGGGSGSGGDDSLEPSFVDGVKVLTRPEDYDFDAATGSYSQNFFNIMAYWIMYGLYTSYSDLSFLSSFNIYNAIAGIDDTENNIDYEDTVYDDFYKSYKLYLYDSIRYTITDVSTTKTTGSSTTIQTVALDTSSAWTWSVPISTANSLFSNYNGDDPSVSVGKESNNKINVTFTYSSESTFDDWTDINTKPSDYFSYYYGSRVYKTDNCDVVDYYTSPYTNYGGKGNNYYQDALEYAIYMTVLGYTIDEDADFFDFAITTDTSTDTSKGVTGMTVGGWETNKISVEDALTKAKEKFENQSTYVGITDDNITEITNFILKKVIGDEAMKKTTFTVSGVSISRDYANVVKNIVTYACTQAPIGSYIYENENGETKTQPLTLSNQFLTSTITDYSGDYFGISLETDEDGNYSDENLFANIDVAEYQSIVFYPQEEDLGKKLTDLWLIFEYYELPTGSTKEIDTENGITINVGVRYHNCATSTVTEIASTTVTVLYAKNGDTQTAGNGSDPLTMVCFGEDDSGVDAQFSTSPVINTQFTSPGAITAPSIGSIKNSVQINGTSSAYEYYTLVKSSSSGSYGVLNSTKFDGTNGCDYIEVYFDIVKDKTSSSTKSYAFKVGATIFFEDV